MDGAYSYNSWKNNFNRQVKKGEHGIKIFAPIIHKDKETEAEKLNPVTKLPVIDENGQPVTEALQPVSNLQMRFKTVSVFDIMQTEGDALPELAETLTGDVERYELFMDALRAVSPLPIEFVPLTDADGFCIFGEKIQIREGMSEIQTISAVLHEITHAKRDIRNNIADNDTPVIDRRTEEVIAESCSFSVASAFGLDTGANSFGYIGSWSRDKELKELSASLDIIRRTSAELIDSISDKYRELAIERGIDLITAVAPKTEAPAISEAEAHVIAETDISKLLAAYTANYAVTEKRPVGTVVLMPPVFDEGNFNRVGKKIRVSVEEPIGKYQLFSREEHDDKILHFLTASGRIDRISEYFRDEWNEEQHKWVNIRPTEADFDRVIENAAELFEKDLSDPVKWAKFQHAAVLNRLDECETHNAPVRKLLAEEEHHRREEQVKQDTQERLQKQVKYDSRVDTIAAAILKEQVVSVGYDEHEFDGKNPVLDLFRLYGIDLPLRTQGWVNTGLAEITGSSYRYYSGKHKGDSTAFRGYLNKLRDAVKLTPIEQLRGKPEVIKEVISTLESKLYKKFAEMFPDFMSPKYSYMKLESPGFEPLSLEWIFGDRISVMQTYVKEGDLMYDPMIEYTVNSVNKTLNAVTYQNSEMGLYQYHDENGIGRSVDGNGNSHEVRNLSGKLNEFSMKWFSNLKEQEHVPVRATLWNEGNIDDVDVTVTFDKDGNAVIDAPEEQRKPVGYLSFVDSGEVMAYYSADDILAAYKREMGSRGAECVRYRGVVDEDLEQKLYAAYAGEYGEDIAVPEEPEKVYDLGYGFLGNGITVWNRAEEVNGDYVTVAHIETDRSVKLYDENMPQDVKDSITRTAQSHDTWAFGFTPALNVTPEEVQAEKLATLDLSLPDPTVSAADRNEYGYIYDGMLPMTTGRAVDLFDSGYPIFLLYPDNTEAMALDRDEIRLFDGLCGIERGDWETSPEYMRVQEDVAANTESRRESDLLYADMNMYGIYQIRNDVDESRNFRFAPMRELEAHGIIPDRADYKLVYTAPLTIRDTQTNLHRIFGVLQHDNPECPQDFKGHSVSVSDVIVLQWHGEISSHFVDSAGFVEINGFIGGETPETHETAQIISDVSDMRNSSGELSETSEIKVKPSILAELEENKRQIANGKKSETHKNNDLEV